MSNLREAQKQETRLKLMKTAMRLFLSKGYETVTLNEVADAAGIHVQTLYKHFKTKLSLATSYFDITISEAIEKIEGVSPDDNVYQLWKQHTLKQLKVLNADASMLPTFQMIHAHQELLTFTQFRIRSIEDVLVERFIVQKTPSYTPVQARLLSACMVSAYRDAHFEWVRSEGKLNSYNKIKQFMKEIEKRFEV